MKFLSVCLALAACSAASPSGLADAQLDVPPDSGADTVAALDATAGKDGSIFCTQDCDDHNPCTDDVCYIKIGCTHVPHSGKCDDDNPCTTGDFCTGDTCAGDPLSCDDGSACTDDACVLPNGCTHTTHC